MCLRRPCMCFIRRQKPCNGPILLHRSRINHITKIIKPKTEGYESLWPIKANLSLRTLWRDTGEQIIGELVLILRVSCKIHALVTFPPPAGGSARYPSARRPQSRSERPGKLLSTSENRTTIPWSCNPKTNHCFVLFTLRVLIIWIQYQYQKCIIVFWCLIKEYLQHISLTDVVIFMEVENIIYIYIYIITEVSEPSHHWKQLYSLSTNSVVKR